MSGSHALQLTGSGGGGNGTVTSVGVNSTTLDVSGSPITNTGNITVNLPSIGNSTVLGVGTGGNTTAGPVQILAGTGISVTGGNGTLTIGTTGGGGAQQVYNSFTGPNTGNFSWVNQGNATVTDNANGGIYIEAPTSSGDNLRCRVVTAPNSAWTVTVAVLSQVFDVNFQTAGMVIRDSVGGRCICLCVSRDASANWTYAITRFTSVTAFNSTTLGLKAVQSSGLAWLRMALSGVGGNLTYSVSQDGYNFIPILTESATAWIGSGNISQVGFYVNSNNTTYKAGITLLSWS